MILNRHSPLILFLFVTYLFHFSVNAQHKTSLTLKADSLVRFLSSDITMQVLGDSLPIYLRSDKYDEEILVLKSKLEGDGTPQNTIQLYKRLAEIYQAKGIEGNAKEYFLKSLGSAEQIDDMSEMAWLNAQIGHIIRLGSVLDEYKKYYQNAVSLFEFCEKPTCKVESNYIQALLSNDGLESLDLLLKAENVLLEQLADNSGNSKVWEAMGRVYNQQAAYIQNEDQKLVKYQQAVKYSMLSNDQLMLAFLYNNIGYVYYKRDENHLALDWYIKALNISAEEGYKGLIRNSINNIANSYRVLGDFETAYGYLKGTFYLTSSLSGDSFNNQMVRSRSEYDLGKAELQNDLLLKDQVIKSRQTIVLAIVTLLFAAFFALAVYSRRKITKANKRLEEQADKLQELDKVKSRFFANISHELKTPLSLIKIPIEDLLHQQKSTSDNNRKKLEIAYHNTVHLQQLIEEIMDLAKLESGKMKLRAAPLLLRESIDTIISHYDLKIKEAGIRLNFIFDIDNQTSVFLDERVLSKIIHNLLSNAVKFTPRFGEITLKIGWLSEGRLSVKVIDSGIGIHPKDLPLVFNRFYQSERPEAVAQGGTGIGLALSKEMATLLGGELSVTSELNKGAIFEFIAPVEVIEGNIAEVLPAELPIDNVNKQLSETIDLYIEKFTIERPVLLIAEDHPQLQFFLKDMLSPFFHVITANNGQIAFDILERERVDLLISDVMMPFINGFELLEKIKKSERLQSISIIMLTARNASEDKIEALNMGIDDYITKPFNQGELKARVKNILQNRIKLFRSVLSSEDPLEKSLEDEMEYFSTNFNFTKREVEVLYYLRKRLSNDEIAETIFVSLSTVKFHLNNVYFKLGIKRRKDALKPMEDYKIPESKNYTVND